jgi:hypothetical protein
MLAVAIKTARARPLNVPNMKSRQPFIALCVALPPQLLWAERGKVTQKGRP